MRPSSCALIMIFWAISWKSPQFTFHHANYPMHVLACSWAIRSIHTTNLALFYHHPSSCKEAPSVFCIYSYHPCSQHNLFPYIEHFLLSWVTIMEFLLSSFLTPKRMKILLITLASFHTPWIIWKEIYVDSFISFFRLCRVFKENYHSRTF